jgi:hypothetical protein
LRKLIQDCPLTRREVINQRAAFSLAVKDKAIGIAQEFIEAIK